MQLRYIAKCTQEVKQPLETSQFRIEPTSLDCYLCLQPRDTRQNLFVEPVAYSSLVFMDQSLGFYVSTQLGEGGGGDGHLTR